MSHATLKYGIKYDPRGANDDSSGVGWIVVAILVVVAVSFVITLVGRISSAPDKSNDDQIVLESAEPQPTHEEIPPPSLSAGETIEIAGFSQRSPKVKSLLMRLEKAAEEADLEMQISTIEQIRAIGGGDTADLADELLPRLGALNMSWLFDKKNPQWVSRVKVRDGDTASRIAREHGSTLLSLCKLNGWSKTAKIVVGREIYVMNHPRFYLVLKLRTRVLDLYLNGKVFKRYLMPDGTNSVKLTPGDYRTPANIVEFFRVSGISLPKCEVDEINMLIPRNVPFNVTSS